MSATPYDTVKKSIEEFLTDLRQLLNRLGQSIQRYFNYISDIQYQVPVPAVDTDDPNDLFLKSARSFLEDLSKHRAIDAVSQSSSLPQTSSDLFIHIRRMLERISILQRSINLWKYMTITTVNQLIEDVFDYSRFDRRAGLGHTTPAPGDSFIWMIGDLKLTLDEKLIVEGTQWRRIEDIECKQLSEIDIEEVLYYTHTKNLLVGAYNLSTGKSEVSIDSSSAESLLISKLALCLHTALTIIRMPQYCVDTSSNEAADIFFNMLKHLWTDLRSQSSERLLGHCSLIHNSIGEVAWKDSITLAHDYTRNSNFTTHWESFGSLLDSDITINEDTFIEMVAIWTLRLSLLMGSESLHEYPLRTYFASKLYLQSMNDSRSSLQEVCTVVWRNYAEVFRAFPKQCTANSLVSRIHRHFSIENDGAPVTFNQVFKDPHKVLSHFNSYILHINNWSKELAGDEKLYAPFFPLIQSSGSGKTRLIKEMIHRMPTYYICLRPSTSSGQPPRSPVVANKLLKVPYSANIIGSYYTIFFLRLLCKHWVLFERAMREYCNQSELPALIIHQGNQIFHTLPVATVATASNKLSCEKFWYEIFEDSTNLSEQILEELSSRTDITSQRELVEKIFHPEQWKTSTFNDEIGFIKELFNSISHPKKLPILVAIDEASYLLPREVDSESTPERNASDSKFYQLRKTLQLFSGLIVAVALDTNCCLWNFAPVSRDDSSFRVVNHEFFLADPFYCLPFPWNLTLDKKLRKFTDCVFGEDGYPSFLYNRFEMILHSRPLFSGILELAKFDSLSQFWCTLAELATVKLIGAHSISQSECMRTRCLSIFGARFAVVPLDMKVAFQMVGNNMATLRDLSGDRSHAKIRYVAESLIAEASARYMNSNSNFSNLLNCLCKLLLVGCIGTIYERGSFGEFAASLILARAFDRAHGEQDALDIYPIRKMTSRMKGLMTPTAIDTVSVSFSANNERSGKATKVDSAQSQNVDGIVLSATSMDGMGIEYLSHPHAGAPIAVRKFFESLLGSKWTNFSNQYFEKNRSKAMQTLLSGWMQFLQFIPNKATQVVSRDMIWSCYRRHVAIHTSRGYPGMDIIIPIMYFSCDKTLRISVLGVEVKNRADPTSQLDHRINVAKLLLATRKLFAEDPVALLVMYLRAGIQGRGNNTRECADASDTEINDDSTVWMNSVKDMDYSMTQRRST